MERVFRLAQHPRVQGRCTVVVVVAIGSGGPMVDFYRLSLKEYAGVGLKSTAGEETKFAKGTWFVPKAMLLDRLEYVLRMKKLRIGEGPLTEALIRELTLLEREVRSSEYVAFSTPPAKVHDDLVMALAMLVWLAWEAHRKYLEAPGLIALVTNSGVMEGGPHHPLVGPNLRLPGARFPDRYRDEDRY